MLPFRCGAIKTGSTILGLLLSASLTSFGQSDNLDTLQTVAHKPPVQENFGKLQAADFNKGLITSIEQAISGKIAGLRIAPHSGAPGSPYTIEAGHGNSFVGNNSSLVVVDGVILSYANVSMNTGILSFLNPEDVESVTLLQDAAAIALYGGKAVNGVLVIKTKAGRTGNKTRVRFSSTGAVSSLRKKADVHTADEMRTLVQSKYPAYAHLAGEQSTDWQDEIFQNGFSLANNLSLSGLIKSVPYRFASGHLSQQGILKTSGRDRTSLSLSLNPSLFKDHLTLDLSLFHTAQRLQLASERAISQALTFDPTQPVYTPNKYGGYFVHYHNNRVVTSHPNPISILEQQDAYDRTNTWLGQAHLRYKLHFLPSMSVNYRQSLHKSGSFYHRATDLKAAFLTSFTDLHTQENNIKYKYKEAFVDFDQEIEGIRSQLTFTGGMLMTDRHLTSEYRDIGTISAQQDRMRWRLNMSNGLDYYGKLTFSLLNRYNFEASARYQGSPKTRISTDPLSKAASIGWDLQKEVFLNNVHWLTELKLSASAGIFERLDNPGQFLLLHTNQFGFSPDVASEKTLIKRLQLTYGLLRNRVQGSLAYYHNNSRDLLMAFLPPGIGLPGHQGRSNGELRSSGYEATLLYEAVQQANFFVKLGLNAGLTNSEVIGFGYPERTEFHYLENHNYSLISEVGYPIQSFRTFKQLYGPDGKIMDGYERQNNLRVSQTQGSVKPKVLAGIHSDIGYKRWNASTLLRGNFGNQVYNSVNALHSWFHLDQDSYYLQNASRTYEQTGFRYSNSQSDYFLEPGSFIRLEYLQLQYNFGRIAGDKANLKLHASTQNAFVLTKYSGMDPEVRCSIDRGLTPQPRTFSVGLQLGI